VTAFKSIAKAILTDENVFQLTYFVRPIRGPPSHAPDADARMAALPVWARKGPSLPLTQWAFAQPW
jgi:hypothetical protein